MWLWIFDPAIPRALLKIHGWFRILPHCSRRPFQSGPRTCVTFQCIYWSRFFHHMARQGRRPRIVHAVAQWVTWEMEEVFMLAVEDGCQSLHSSGTILESTLSNFARRRWSYQGAHSPTAVGWVAMNYYLFSFVLLHFQCMWTLVLNLLFEWK